MAGAGYKLFNSGDVLTAAQVNTYLMEQTVMVFNDAAARTTALSGVLSEGMISYLKDTNATEVYNGSAWVGITGDGDITGVTAGTGISGGGTTGTVTITNDMATTITAKGDIVAGTGNATYDNLAAGSNGDTLVADSSATTGLRWQSDWNTGKNKIINGDFGIWQRGTSFTANGYTSDRWLTAQGSSSGFSVTRQTFTPGTAPVSGYEGQYFVDVAGTITSATAGYIQLNQRIEDVRTLANQTVTLSFWAKGSANGTINSLLLQNFGSGGSTAVLTSTNSHSLTTSWQRFTVTYTVPSVSGKTIGTSSYLEIYFVKNMGSDYPTYGSSNYTGTLSIWGVQLEAGSVATPFTTATGTLAGELAACQRYYSKSYPQAIFADGVTQTEGNAQGIAVTTSNCFTYVPFPVTMRVSPTVNVYAGAGGQGAGSVRDNSTGPVITGVAVVNSNTGIYQISKATAFTVGRGYGYEYTASAEL